MEFRDLHLIEPLLRAVEAEGYTEPTPIQEQAIPHVLLGRDLLGCAQTGTGKTAAFALPILQRLVAPNAVTSSASSTGVAPAQVTPQRPSGHRNTRVLVLSPTRELATQIGESFAVYGKHLGMRHTVIFGGVGQEPQTRAMRAGVDILVATPGRLLDLMNQGYVRFDKLEVFVLDEADRMLDMGFIHDVKRIIAALPPKRQNLLFSATMPPDVQEIADKILRDPVKVAVVPPSTTAEKIDQSVYFVEKNDKRKLLELLLRNPEITRALVFTRTKHGANRVAEHLDKANIGAAAIHGNKSQSARERALANFKSGDIRVLVATDIAARGIDVDGISHVFNFELPNIPESYVHRIGRTARAGASGIAISFCEQEERPFLVDIERLIQLNVPVVDKHAFPSHLGVPRPTALDSRERSAARPASHQQRSEGRPRNQQQRRPEQRRSDERGTGSRQPNPRRTSPQRSSPQRSSSPGDARSTLSVPSASASDGNGGERRHGDGGHQHQPRRRRGGSGGGSGGRSGTRAPTPR